MNRRGTVVVITQMQEDDNSTIPNPTIPKLRNIPHLIPDTILADVLDYAKRKISVIKAIRFILGEKHSSSIYKV